MNTNICPVVVDSNGDEHVSFDVLLDTFDMVGRPIRVAMNQLSVETPFGVRAVMTAYIFMNNGDKSVYSGSTIQSPKDPFSYRSAFLWALYRAGEDYVARRWASDAALTKFVVDAKGKNSKRIHAWASHVWRKMVYENGMDPDSLESILKKTKDTLLSNDPEKIQNLNSKLEMLSQRVDALMENQANLSEEDISNIMTELIDIFGENEE